LLGPFLFFPSRNIFWQAISHVFFAFNFSSATTTALNGVLWSLAIEVQFYVLFPLICLAFERSAAVTFVAMSAIAVLYRFWSSACCDTTSAVRYQLPAFLDFFACGMLASLIFSYGMSRGINTEGSSKAWWTLASVASLTAVIVLVRYVPDAIGRGDALFYLAAAFLILAVTTAFSKSWWQGIFSNKILVFLSVISYNLYLYHLIVSMSLAYRLHFPPSDHRIPQTDSHWQIAFVVVAGAVSIAIATIVTFAFERPLLRLGHGLSRREFAIPRWLNFG